MHRTDFAPVLSATSSRDSVWIISVVPNLSRTHPAGRSARTSGQSWARRRRLAAPSLPHRTLRMGRSSPPKRRARDYGRCAAFVKRPACSRPRAVRPACAGSSPPVPGTPPPAGRRRFPPAAGPPTSAASEAASAGVQEQQADAPGQHVLDRARIFMAGGEAHHGRGQAAAQMALGGRAGRRPRPASVPYRCRPGAALMEVAGGPGRGAPDQRQVSSHSGRRPRQQPGIEALLQHVLGHGAVGRPLAAGHGDQAAAAHQHGVLAAERLGRLAVVALRLDQRPQARPRGCGCPRVRGARTR